MLRAVALVVIGGHKWYIRWNVRRKMFASQEPFVSRLFLLFDWIEAVDELPASYRVFAKISALRRDLAKQALHVAPY